MFCRSFPSGICVSLAGTRRSFLLSRSRITFGVSASSYANSPLLRHQKMGVDEGGDAVEGAARIPKEAKRILHKLASKWSGTADSKALQVVRMKGAMTNEVYQVDWIAHSHKVLVRIYGEGVGVFFNRDDEIRTFECMSRHEQGPRLLGRFTNGRVEEFINARPLSANDLRDPEISGLIASKLREFHDLDMPGSRNVFLWERLRNWSKEALRLCPIEESKEFRLAALEEEINHLEKALTLDDQKIGFCHNDLQYGNIMMDEASRQVIIIDYEYASFNPIAYDLANHFCEMAADYHTETPHILDFSKYPDHQERTRFVRVYLNFSAETSKEQEVDRLLLQIEKYAVACHLLWGLWGVISAHVNEINFDYLAYARQRFQQYELMKPNLLPPA